MLGNFVYPQLQVLHHAILFKKHGGTSLCSSTVPLCNWWIGRGCAISSARQLTGHHNQRFFFPMRTFEWQCPPNSGGRHQRFEVQDKNYRISRSWHVAIRTAGTGIYFGHGRCDRWCPYLRWVMFTGFLWWTILIHTLFWIGLVTVVKRRMCA